MLEILNADGLSIEQIRTRQPMETDVTDAVREILCDVRENGDEALYRLSVFFFLVCKLDYTLRSHRLAQLPDAFHQRLTVTSRHITKRLSSQEFFNDFSFLELHLGCQLFQEKT